MSVSSEGLGSDRMGSGFLILTLGLLAACGRTDFSYLSTDSAGSDDSGTHTGESTGSSTGEGSTTDFETTGLPTDSDATETIDPSTTGPIPIECGNGLLEPGEECDPGIEDIGNDQACVPGCLFNICGDGLAGPDEPCDDGNEDQTDACSPACSPSFCGDGIVWSGVETCDDGDNDDTDVCHLDCTPTRVASVSLGGNHSCARLDNGAVRCWGNGNNGRTGLGSPENLGDDEPAGVGSAVGLGSPVVEIATGLSHTCVRYENGQLRCFGRAAEGQLGYGNVDDVGDDESPSDVGFLQLFGPVSDIGLRGGSFHTCAVLAGGIVRCWGLAGDGRLGVPGVTGSVGDDESPAAIAVVDVGGTTTQITTGVAHTCARLSTGELRCWGSNASGQLGYGLPQSIGDDEDPADAGAVPVGGAVMQVTAGFHHTCALLDSGLVRCWGRGNNGRLGLGNTTWVGINDTPADVGTVNVGGPVVQIEAGNAHTCARLDGGAVRCWGWAGQGQLGYGNLEDIGDDEDPASAGDVPLSGPAIAIAADGNHSCALLSGGAVQCWGNGGDGRLGYGAVDTIGDDETPADVGVVPLLL